MRAIAQGCSEYSITVVVKQEDSICALQGRALALLPLHDPPRWRPLIGPGLISGTLLEQLSDQVDWPRLVSMAEKLTEALRSSTIAGGLTQREVLSRGIRGETDFFWDTTSSSTSGGGEYHGPRRVEAWSDFPDQVAAFVEMADDINRAHEAYDPTDSDICAGAPSNEGATKLLVGHVLRPLKRMAKATGRGAFYAFQSEAPVCGRVFGAAERATLPQKVDFMLYSLTAEGREVE